MGSDTLWGWHVGHVPDRFFTNAAIVGYYAAFARGFPAYARATGTGFVLGIGRAGAAGSPIIAGSLFTWLGNDELLTVSAIMSIGAILGAGLFLDAADARRREAARLDERAGCSWNAPRAAADSCRSSENR